MLDPAGCPLSEGILTASDQIGLVGGHLEVRGRPLQVDDALAGGAAGTRAAADAALLGVLRGHVWAGLQLHDA